jgi:hypothetical protein
LWRSLGDRLTVKRSIFVARIVIHGFLRVVISLFRVGFRVRLHMESDRILTIRNKILIAFGSWEAVRLEAQAQSGRIFQSLIGKSSISLFVCCGNVSKLKRLKEKVVSADLRDGFDLTTRYSQSEIFV